MKLPRDLSGQRVVQARKRLGFIEEREEGSHVRLVRGSLRVTVPAHLRPGRKPTARAPDRSSTYYHK